MEYYHENQLDRNMVSSKICCTYMRDANQWGPVINISSISDRQELHGGLAYSGSKEVVVTLSKLTIIVYEIIIFSRMFAFLTLRGIWWSQRHLSELISIQFVGYLYRSICWILCVKNTSPTNKLINKYFETKICQDGYLILSIFKKLS